MPVKKKKKNDKERLKKKKKKHEESLDLPHERDRIKYLVDKIPSLIMQDRDPGQNQPPIQAYKQFDMPESSQEKNRIAEVLRTDKNKYRWLWFGVGIFSAAIFFVWFYHIRTFISDIRFSESNEQDVFEQSKFDLQNTLKLLSQDETTTEKESPEKNETAKEKTNFLNNLKESLLSLSISGNSSTTQIKATSTEDNKDETSATKSTP
ncbi:MAG: hypothetical protein HYY51_02165 [Candidatus Magasanikbacteria bacterium]|nr:hypothetical protein [Candidatus Magasanikbacteria bacterium]